MLSRLLRTAAGGLAACLLLNINAMAQTPTVTVHDYLSEVRIFANGSPDFAKIAASLGADATLPTLGAGSSLVVALRNDSGEAIDSMRILYQVHQGAHTFGRITLYGSLPAGASVLTAPRELAGAVMALTSPRGVLSSPSSAQPIDDYLGAQITASIDSVTLASGRFLGDDTLAFFSRLVENDARQKSFFSDLTVQVKTLPEAEVKQMLTTRKAAATAAKRRSTSVANFPLADQIESGLCSVALVKLQTSGMSTLAGWAERENAKLQSKPTLHK